METQQVRGAGSREPITRTINSSHQHHPVRVHHQDVPFRWRFRRASSNSHCFHRSNGSSTLDLETSWSNLAIGRGEQSRSGESNSQLAVAGRVTQRTPLSERSSEFRVVGKPHLTLQRLTPTTSCGPGNA